MNLQGWLLRPYIRNFIGLVALLLVFYIPDRFFLSQRTGFQQILPYLLLLTLYGWIVFHNRILFDRLYLRNRRREYFGWTALFLTAASLNMHFTIIYLFQGSDTLPKILSLWIFTVTGTGIYILFRYRHRLLDTASANIQAPSSNLVSHLSFVSDGKEWRISVNEILYVESLENYVKVITARKTHVVRLSLKEAESRLPRQQFLRISRSHLVNIHCIESGNGESIKVNRDDLKVGKVYKRHVEEQLSLHRSIGYR